MIVHSGPYPNRVHFSQALGIGGWLIVMLALAGPAVLVGRRMTEQAKGVGLLKAVGATPMTVAVVLLVEQLILAVAAATAGLVAGMLIARRLTVRRWPARCAGRTGDQGLDWYTVFSGIDPRD